MPDVFILSAPEHSPLVAELTAELESQGIHVNSLAVTAPSPTALAAEADAIAATKAVVVIWPPDLETLEQLRPVAEHAGRDGRLLALIAPGSIRDNWPASLVEVTVLPIEDRPAVYDALVRLGLLARQPEDAVQPPDRLPDMKSWRSSVLPLVGLAAGVLLALSGLIAMRPIKPVKFPEGRLVSQAGDAFLRELRLGLGIPNMLADTVRVDGVGALARDDVVRELRRVSALYAKIDCRHDGRPTAAPGPQAIVGAKAVPASGILKGSCNFFDRTGKIVTRPLSLGLQVVLAEVGGRELIVGMWQPDGKILWQPRTGR